jgi:hypothetical protein
VILQRNNDRLAVGVGGEIVAEESVTGVDLPPSVVNRGEARAQQGVHQSTVVTMFSTISHCSMKKNLFSLGAQAPTVGYLAPPLVVNIWSTW